MPLNKETKLNHLFRKISVGTEGELKSSYDDVIK